MFAKRSSYFGLAALCVAAGAGSAQAASCGDPWVTQLTTKYLHHAPSSPNAPQCNINLYRNGHWANYADLDSAMDAHWAVYPDPDKPVAAPPPGGFAISRSTFTPNQAQFLPIGTLVSSRETVYLYNGSWYSLVSQGGGNWVTPLVSQGGGNLVSQGGGNMVSTSVGYILLNGGANLAKYKAAMGIR